VKRWYYLVGKENIVLRPANKQDCRYVWELRNHPTAREYSINNNEIPYDSHEKWFTAALHDDKIKIFVIVYKGNEVGTIRFNLEKENPTNAYVSIVISPDSRNSGLGSAILKKASEFAIKEFKLDKILAKIKPDNNVSIKAFTNAGYKFIEKEDIFTMEYRLNDSNETKN
jgi:RimJ/RimL family protein N-acetyltransferase